MSINEVYIFLQLHIHLHIVFAFPTNLNSCNRHHMAQKPKLFIIWPVTGKVCHAYYRARPFSFLLNYLFLIRKQENAHIWNILHALLIVFLSLERQTKVKRPFPGIWLSYYKAEEILYDTGIVHSAVWMVSEPNQPHYLERTTGWKNLNSLYLGTPTQLFRVVALKHLPKAKQRSSPNSRFRTENVFWDRHSHFSFPKRIKTT